MGNMGEEQVENAVEHELKREILNHLARCAV
ncbi:MAG: hypothetical protein QOF64_1214, partial [Candidatus Binatota bacterium]|nr:hypothetical protein [Candidatus Binatota bacterium]